MRKLVSVSIALFALMILPDIAMACPSCYGAISDTEVARGLQLAMLSLIGAITVIGVGVVVFFSNIKKRAAMYEAGELDLPPDNPQNL